MYNYNTYKLMRFALLSNHIIFQKKNIYISIFEKKTLIRPIIQEPGLNKRYYFYFVDIIFY